MSRIVRSLEQALASARCAHEFKYAGPFGHMGGESAICTLCKCRFTAWPGTIHYDEIVAARSAQNKETG